MIQVQLQSQTGSVSIAQSTLVSTSKVFANMITENESITEWPLYDFTQLCLEQFVDFALLFQASQDIKFPSQLTSQHIDDHIPKLLANFLSSKTNEQVIELLLLANYIESTTLFQLCCVHIGCLMMIPQHDIMAQTFGISLDVPSTTLIDTIISPE